MSLWREDNVFGVDLKQMMWVARQNYIVVLCCCVSFWIQSFAENVTTALSFTHSYSYLVYLLISVCPKQWQWHNGLFLTRHIHIPLTNRIGKKKTSFKLNNIWAAFEVIVQRIPQFHSIYWNAHLLFMQREHMDLWNQIFFHEPHDINNLCRLSAKNLFLALNITNVFKGAVCKIY